MEQQGSRTEARIVERTDGVADEGDGREVTRSPWPRRGALLTLVLLVGVGAAYGTRLGTDPTVVDSPLIGQPAPSITLPNLEKGGHLSLAGLRGDVVVLNF